MQVDAIGWSGTSAGWLGFSKDEQLCQSLGDRFGIPFTTSTLALNKVLKLAHVKKLGLVTPYTPDMNQLIMRNYSELGYPIPSERAKHIGITKNSEIASVDEEQLTAMVKEVVEAGADAVTTFCTNWNAAHLVAGWEQAFGVPVFDSVGKFCDEKHLIPFSSLCDPA
jgi:maleate isomerase